ncbi:MAG: helix-turn-helix domain-containing protein [Candidatus Pristimantibacillus sp.]
MGKVKVKLSWRAKVIPMPIEETPQEFIENYYFVPDEFDTQSGLWPVRFGQNEAKSGYRAGPKSIEYYSMHFVRSGAVELDTGGEKIELSEGDLFCLFPQQTHSYRKLESKSALEMSWIAIDGPQVPMLLSMVSISTNTPYARKKITKEILLTLQQLLQSGSTNNRYNKLRRSSLLYRIFSQLLGQADKAEVIRNSPKEWIADSMEYMRAYYREQIGVQQVAEHIGIHRTHFSKLFTEQVGINPSDYLRKLRMEQAVIWLRASSRSVLEIGLSLGYSDAASFTRAFGQYFGCSPTQIRMGSGLTSTD